MRTELLISLEDFEPYKGITGNLPAIKVLQPHILLAQQIDVEPILGTPFIVDILNNISTSKYQDLLNGKDYTNENGDVTYFQGLRAVIVMYSYSRYILNKNVNDTAFGMVQKTNEFSQSVSESTIVRLARNAESQAKFYEKQLVDFLNENEATYTLWKSCKTKENGRGFARINAI